MLLERERVDAVRAVERLAGLQAQLREPPLVDGVVAGVWRIGKKGEPEVEPFGALERADRAALEAELECLRSG